jgi:uncharacterized protein
MQCFFVSDLHGHERRYRALFDVIRSDGPDVVFFGGDLLPAARRSAAALYPPVRDFVDEYFRPQLLRLREQLGSAYPQIVIIPGNDDARSQAAALEHTMGDELWTWANERILDVGGHDVLGYGFVPPTPFRCKDWERYDVSRFVDPGCIHPEEGFFTTDRDENDLRYRTIEDDLKKLTEGREVSRMLLLFHTPPYRTSLDRAALDGRSIDHVPLDVHVGSIAVRNFILQRQPLLSMHGHIHEAARLTGAWKETLGTTWCYSAAHDGPELALVRFDPSAPDAATRELL